MFDKYLFNERANAFNRTEGKETNGRGDCICCRLKGVIKEARSQSIRGSRGMPSMLKVEEVPRKNNLTLKEKIGERVQTS